MTTVLVIALVALAGCSGDTGEPTSEEPTTESGPAPVTSTFDSGAEGWSIVGDAQSREVAPDHVADGGAPGGHLEATDDVTGGVWYWNASAAYLGDKSAYAGGTLSFELRQSSTSSQFDATDVILESGDTRLGYDFGDETTHPGTDWTSYEVALSANGWTNLESEEPATAAEVEQVLADLDSLTIRGEYREGSDTGSLDTVELAA